MKRFLACVPAVLLVLSAPHALAQQKLFKVLQFNQR